MSPSSSTRSGLGMPCTISSLIEAQMEAGKPRYPLKEGIAPSCSMMREAIFSSSAVVMPGRTTSRKRSWTWATMRPAWRMSANSREDLRTIILTLHVFAGDEAASASTHHVSP